VAVAACAAGRPPGLAARRPPGAGAAPLPGADGIGSELLCLSAQRCTLTPCRHETTDTRKRCCVVGQMSVLMLTRLVSLDAAPAAGAAAHGGRARPLPGLLPQRGPGAGPLAWVTLCPFPPDPGVSPKPSRVSRLRLGSRPQRLSTWQCLRRHGVFQTAVDWARWFRPTHGVQYTKKRGSVACVYIGGGPLHRRAGRRGVQRVGQLGG
jgi:hypothetical protein